ncbi:MAG: pyridoxal phosphate-dependent aminotransferase [Bacteroidota bacterium]
MFLLSRRVREIEESQTLALTALALKLKAEGVDVISLTAGEPDFPTPAHVKQAAVKAIEEDFTHYTANDGIPELRKAIAQKFARDNNLHFKSEEILVSCGAKHSVFNAVQALCDSGDEAVVISPYWVSYPEIVKLANAKPVIVQTSADADFKLTAAQLKRAVTSRTKLLILNSPGNPTGTVYTREEIEELAQVVHAAGIFVIADEIYEKVIYGGIQHFSIGSINRIADQVITVNGVSKAFAMTGWRIGYIGGRKDVVAAAAKVQSQTTSNPTSISQKAALAAITGPEDDLKKMTAEFQRRRDFLCKQLGSVKEFQFRIPQGAFYLFPKIDSLYGRIGNNLVLKNSGDLSQYLLKQARVASVPGTAFGAKDYIRLSYACSVGTLETAVDRIRSAVLELKPL